MKSPLRYPGGKSRAVKTILSEIPRDIKTYLEPFLGGGSVFLALLAERPWLSFSGNDLDAELIGFWQALQNPVTAGKVVAQAALIRHRSETAIRYYCEAAREKETLSPAEYYILNRCSFSGTVRMGGLGPGLTRFTFKQIESLLNYPESLSRVSFTCEDYTSFLAARADRDSFTFVDPPYIGIDGLYACVQINHERLAAGLKCLPGRWLLTLNDCPEVRALYAGCNVRPLALTYGMNNCSKAGKQKRATELMISNY